MRQFSTPSRNIPGRTDFITVGEMSDVLAAQERAQPTGSTFPPHFSAAMLDGATTPDKWREFMRSGSQRHVAQSEAFLHALEDAFPPATARHEVVNDVMGGVPNIGAYLAGSPLNMRRKAPRENEGAPVTICVDTGLAADIVPSAYAKRGAAVVALIRQIQARRPVELYACAVTGHGRKESGNASGYFYRVETLPLDIARAAFILGSAGFARGGIYRLLSKETKWAGQFAYSRAEPTLPEHGTRICQAAFIDREDVVYIPRARVQDASMKDPVAWVKAQAARFMGDILEDAA